MQQRTENALGLGRRSLILFLFLFGFTATALQIVYLREFLSLFYGNELSIGLFMFSWMLWTALGSFLFGKIKQPQTYVHVHLFLFSLIIPFTSLALQYLRFRAQPVIGTLPDLLSTLSTAFLGLFLFGLFSGGLFPLYTGLLKKVQKQSSESSGGRVYLWETVGSAVSGLLAGLWLIRLLPTRELIVGFALLNLIISLYFVLRLVPKQRAFSASMFALIFLSEGVMFARSDARLTARLWDGLQIVERRSSLYGQLTLTSLAKTRTLYQNGVPLFTVPDVQTAEETVHYAMLLHHRPQKVLLIGGGFSGALFEILKYRSVRSLDYVELDPEIVRLYRQYFSTLWDSLRSDFRVHIHLTDGRLFLQKTRQKYDVIITALPDPFTVQLNRFYTREFFQLVKRKLNKDGIFSFRITGAENFIDRNHARYIQCIHHSFQPVFKQMAFLPGKTIYFFLSNRPDSLPLSVDYISGQLKERHIKTKYVRDYYLTFKLMPDRRAQLQSVLKNFFFPKINEDFKPMAYFFDMVLWSSKFSASLGAKISRLIKLSSLKFSLLFFLLWTLFLSPLLLRRSTASLRSFAPLAMFTVGFTVIGLELIILIAFQVEYGYIYYRIALFIALFMVGMAVGSWLGLRVLPHVRAVAVLKRLLAIHAGFVLIAALLIPILRFSAGEAGHVVFWLSAILSGGLGGFAFPLLSRLFFENNADHENAGTLYAWDLIGALVGSLLSSLVLIPIYGLLFSGFFLALLNLFILLYLWLALFRMDDPHS